MKISKFKIRNVTLVSLVILFAILEFAPFLNAKTVVVAIGDSITYGGTNWQLMGHIGIPFSVAG